MSVKEFQVYTYSADSMCGEPANSTGYWHPGFIFDVLLKNLEVNTRYYYSYGTQQYMSNIANFTTSLDVGVRDAYKFIVYGDMGVDPYPKGVTTSALVREEIEKNDIKFIFHHGDISYARGFTYTWDQWFSIVEPISSLTAYMVGIGNHEYDHLYSPEKDPSHAKGLHGFQPDWFNGHIDSGGECGVPIFKRFHMPDNGNSLFWYSYDYGMVHYTMISTEHDFSPHSPQYDWLEDDLKNVNRTVTPWLIIGGHRAMYCSSALAEDYLVAINMQRLFEDLLYKYKVDMAFWAHYHSYERTCKLYKNKCVDDGILHLVIGSGGMAIDDDVWYNKTWSRFHITDYGYGRVTVKNASALLVEWVQNRSKIVLDTVWLTK